MTMTETGRTRRPAWPWPALAICGLGVVAAALLWPALSGVPFWDDLYSVMAIDIAASRGRPSVAVTGDLMAFWRPIELFLIATLGSLDPVGYLPVKLVSLGLHAVKALAIALLVKRLAPGLPPLCLVLCALVALAHPISVSAIVQIDTVSEAIAAAAIAWALVLVIDAVRTTGRARHVRLAGVVVLSALAVLGKESAVPAVAAMPLIGFIAAPDRRASLAALAGLTLALAVVGIAFVAARYGLGFSTPTTTDGRYAIGFGMNVARNLATIAGSLAFFGNTLALIGERDLTALVGFVPAVLAAGLIGLAALTRRKALAKALDGRAFLALLVMALAATAAPALAPMISEHNAALTSGAFLPAALALTAAAAFVSGKRAVYLAAFAAVLAIAMGLVAMRQKAEAAAFTGHTVAGARAAIDTALYASDRLLVCMTPAEGRAYSIYRLPAERWMEEEILWARRNWPAKPVTAELRPAGPDCDLVVPDFPPASGAGR